MGIGPGRTVSPGLFIASPSVRPTLVGRAFALVQLLRLSSAYLIAPVMLDFALVNGMQPKQLVLGQHMIY